MSAVSPFQAHEPEYENDLSSKPWNCAAACLDGMKMSSATAYQVNRETFVLYPQAASLAE